MIIQELPHTSTRDLIHRKQSSLFSLARKRSTRQKDRFKSINVHAIEGEMTPIKRINSLRSFHLFFPRASKLLRDKSVDSIGGAKRPTRDHATGPLERTKSRNTGLTWGKTRGGWLSLASEENLALPPPYDQLFHLNFCHFYTFVPTLKLNRK